MSQESLEVAERIVNILRDHRSFDSLDICIKPIYRKIENDGNLSEASCEVIERYNVVIEIPQIL